MTQPTTEEPPPVSGAETAPAAASQSPSILDVMRSRGYFVIWSGTVLTFLAYHMSNVAQGVVAYDLTGSNRAVGLVQFAQGLIQVLLNPFAGAIVDRFAKRYLLIGAQALIGLALLGTALLILADSITVFLLSVGSFCIGFAFSFNGSSRTALLSEVMPDEQLDKGMAMIQVGANMPRVAGPFIAGMLLAWPTLGATGVYFLGAAFMGIVTATLGQIPATPVRRHHEGSMISDAWQGFVYVRQTPRILHNVVSFQLIAIYGFNYFVLMPAFIKTTLGGGNAMLGILLGIGAAGGLVSSILVTSATDSRRVPLFVSLSSVTLGFALIGMGAAPGLALAAVAIFFAGAGSAAFQTLSNMLAARNSAPAYIGRVISIMFIAWGLNALSGLPIGVLADALGERTVLAGMGVVVCITTVLLALWHSRIEAAEPGAATSV